MKSQSKQEQKQGNQRTTFEIATLEFWREHEEQSNVVGVVRNDVK